MAPAEINGSSRDGDDSAEALKRDVDAEGGAQVEAQKVGSPAVAEAPRVGAQAVESVQQSRVPAAGKTPQMMQANQGKVAAALAFVLLVLWLRRRRSRRSSRTRDGVAAALDQQVRNVADEVPSTGSVQDKAQKEGDRAAAKAQAHARAMEKAQQARVQAMEKAQQVRAQAVEKALRLREQATETAQAAEKAQQVAQEAQRLVGSLGQRLPRR